MQNVMLRDALVSDAGAILEIMVVAFEQYRDKLNPPSSVFRETPESVSAKLATGGGFVALVGDTMSGCVLYEPKTDYLYLGRLAVLPEYRGQGIARLLVTSVENHAQALNLPRIQLGVRVALTDNQEFFAGLGYRIVSYERHPGHSEPTFVYMEKA